MLFFLTKLMPLFIKLLSNEEALAVSLDTKCELKIYMYHVEIENRKKKHMYVVIYNRDMT